MSSDCLAAAAAATAAALGALISTLFSFVVFVARLRIRYSRPLVSLDGKCFRRILKRQRVVVQVWRDQLRSALNDFRGLLEQDATLSAFELQSSGLVQVN